MDGHTAGVALQVAGSLLEIGGLGLGAVELGERRRDVRTFEGTLPPPPKLRVYQVTGGGEVATTDVTAPTVEELAERLAAYRDDAIVAREADLEAVARLRAEQKLALENVRELLLKATRPTWKAWTAAGLFVAGVAGQCVGSVIG